MGHGVRLSLAAHNSALPAHPMARWFAATAARYNAAMADRSIPGLIVGPVRRRYREVQRLRAIAQILARNGLDFLVGLLGLGRFMPRRLFAASRRPRPGVERLTVPERVRRTLEELGPTYMKMGQILSGRADLLPPAYLHELEKLQNQAAPEPSERIVAILESELGGPVSQFFSEFDPQPVAAASLAQVHKARLLTGEVVAVKVQRPGIREVVEADLDLIRHQAEFVQKRSTLARERGLVAIVDELAFSLQNELDFGIEGRNSRRLRQNLSGLPFALIPQVYPLLSTSRVLVSDYVDGIKLSDVERLRSESYDLDAIAALGHADVRADGLPGWFLPRRSASWEYLDSRAADRSGGLRHHRLPQHRAQGEPGRPDARFRAAGCAANGRHPGTDGVGAWTRVGRRAWSRA